MCVCVSVCVHVWTPASSEIKKTHLTLKKKSNKLQQSKKLQDHAIRNNGPTETAHTLRNTINQNYKKKTKSNELSFDFPEVTVFLCYEGYFGWSQVKRS